MSLLNAAANDNGAGATTVSVTVPSSTAGTSMVAVVGRRANHVTGVTDNLAQTYTAAFTPGAGGTEDPGVWVCPNSAAGVTTITATFSESQGSAIFGLEESGIVLTSPVDAANNTAGAVSATWSTSATAVSAATVGYGVACSTSGSSQAFAADAGWTAVTGTGITSGHHGNATEGNDLFVCRQAFASSGSKTASGTLTSSLVASALVLLEEAALSTALQESEWFPVEPQTNPLTVSVW